MSTMPTQDSEYRERWEWITEHLPKRERRALLYEAIRIVHNREEAEEVYCESLMLAAKYLHQLRDENRLFQWMYTIVHRQANRHKTKYLRYLRALVEIAQRPVKDEVTPEMLMIDEQEKQVIYEMMKCLNDVDRQIVMLRTFSPMKFWEIARKFQLNESTTRARYRRALIKMKKEWRGDL